MSYNLRSCVNVQVAVPPFCRVRPCRDDQQDWQPVCLQDASFMVYELT